MTLAETLIARGKYYLPVEFEKIPIVKRMLLSYLHNRNYEVLDLNQFFYESSYLTMTFHLSFENVKPPLQMKIKQAIGMIDDLEVKTQLYFNYLRAKRIEIPFKVTITIAVDFIDNKPAITLEVISIPIAYYRITQLNKKMIIDRSDFSRIKFENIQFIKETMAAIQASPLEEPKMLSDNMLKNETINKLHHYKFEKIAKLLQEGRRKLECGEDAVSEIFGVIENFLFEVVMRLSLKPSGRENPERQISILMSKGYLSKEAGGTIQSILINGVYSKLKSIDHPKNPIDYFDLSFYYTITEDTIDYLIEKVVKYKLKAPKEVELSQTEK